MSIRLLNSIGFRTATVYEFYLDEFLLKFTLKNAFNILRMSVYNVTFSISPLTIASFFLFLFSDSYYSTYLKKKNHHPLLMNN